MQHTQALLLLEIAYNLADSSPEFLLQLANRSEFLDEEHARAITKRWGKIGRDDPKCAITRPLYVVEDPGDCPLLGDHRGRKSGSRDAVQRIARVVTSAIPRARCGCLLWHRCTTRPPLLMGPKPHASIRGGPCHRVGHTANKSPSAVNTWRSNRRDDEDLAAARGWQLTSWSCHLEGTRGGGR
jgi:hypothetical protein